MWRLGIVIPALFASWAIGASAATAASIKILDQCDPATFNTPTLILCEPQFKGTVTFGDFLELTRRLA